MLYNDAAGKPFQKVYKRIGIRRDRNFSDLSNPTAGLENLLDTLTDVSGTQFLSTDLAAIKNIFARGLTNSAYLNIAGSAVKFTTQSGVTASFNPRITYQNRLDKIQIFSGIPRLNGGDGLTAKYYQNDQITLMNTLIFNMMWIQIQLQQTYLKMKRVKVRLKMTISGKQVILTILEMYTHNQQK